MSNETPRRDKNFKKGKRKDRDGIWLEFYVFIFLNFTLKTPIYFQNEYRLLFLFFSPTVLLVPQNWFKNVDFLNIF